MPKFKDMSHATLASVMARRHKKRRGIIIHESIGYDSLAWLQGASALAGRPASADYLIHRNGDISQITLPGWYAYHTGRAIWRGLQDDDGTLNETFVGIECENDPTAGQVITDAQYIGLAWLCRRLMGVFPIAANMIAGHGEVALPHGRKTDPITLDWTILTRELILPSVESNEYIVRGDLS